MGSRGCVSLPSLLGPVERGGREGGLELSQSPLGQRTGSQGQICILAQCPPGNPPPGIQRPSIPRPSGRINTYIKGYAEVATFFEAAHTETGFAELTSA